MGKTKKGKTPTSFRGRLNQVHSGKKFKQMRKKARRLASDGSFPVSSLFTTPLGGPSNKSKSKMKRKRKCSIKKPVAPPPASSPSTVQDIQTSAVALQYKFRNDHIMVEDRGDPPRDSTLSVSAMASNEGTEDKMMETIVIEDDEEEEEEERPASSASRSMIEEVGEEMLGLVNESSISDEKISLFPNPLYQVDVEPSDNQGAIEDDSQNKEEYSNNHNDSVEIDDEVILVDEKKATESGLTARNIQTMTRRYPTRAGPSQAPDFIPLFSFTGPGPKKAPRSKHVRGAGRNTRGSYRDAVRKNIPPSSSSLRPEPIVAEGPTMMASSEIRKGEKGTLRPVVLDGCNVAMSHGLNKVFSVRGISIAVEYFLRRGHEKVVAFLPQEKCRGRSPEDRNLLEKMETEGNLVYTPSRQFNNETITSYDDTFILDYASQYGAVVVTRDNYRDLTNKKPEWDKVIKDMILMPTFVGDDIMWPHDPQGKRGRSLDDFLKF